MFAVCTTCFQRAISPRRKDSNSAPVLATTGTSFASKNNLAYSKTTEDFVFLCGDDVEFTTGWIQAARAVSDRYDVIGTNDSEKGRVRNPKVASGKHADHFFVRRSYVEEEGSTLEGPGILLFEGYYHFFGDVELIQLAKARGVFTPCLDSVIVHHHPVVAAQARRPRQHPRRHTQQRGVWEAEPHGVWGA
jgi:hypothetical protein